MLTEADLETIIALIPTLHGGSATDICAYLRPQLSGYLKRKAHESNLLAKELRFISWLQPSERLATNEDTKPDFKPVTGLVRKPTS